MIMSLMAGVKVKARIIKVLLKKLVLYNLKDISPFEQKLNDICEMQMGS